MCLVPGWYVPKAGPADSSSRKCAGTRATYLPFSFPCIWLHFKTQTTLKILKHLAEIKYWTLQGEINIVASWNFHICYCKLYLGRRLSNFHLSWVKAPHAACSCCLRTAHFLFCGKCSPGCPSVAVHIYKAGLEAVLTFVLIYYCLGGRYLFPMEKLKQKKTPTLQSVVRTERQREGISVSSWP